VLRPAAVCDTTGTVETPSPAPGVRRYQQVDRSTSVFGATWYDRFPGGCLTYRLHSISDVEHFDGDTTAGNLRDALAFLLGE
jgi:hypothetical protein